MPDTEKLLQAIDNAEAKSYGSENDSDLQQERALSIDLFLGQNIEPAPDGRSQVVDRTVFETVQWILPSLCRIFASGDDVVKLVPFGPEDEQQAEQESDYLNYLVTQKNDWFLTCLTWFQDALLTKNAYCMVFMDEHVQVEKEFYESQSDEQVAFLAQDAEIVAFESFEDEDTEPQQVIDPETGEIVLVPRMLHNVEIKRTKKDKKLCFQVLPPERVKVSEFTPDFSLAKCDYFEYWEAKTISSLRAQGFDVADDIASDVDIDTEEDDARDLFIDDRDEANTSDPSMRRVKVRTVWIRHDYDEDGIAELQRCIVVGKELLFRQEETRIPVASIVPSVLTHRHIGLSVGDIVRDINRIKTAILRHGLDSLYQSLTPRTVINDKINLDDMLVARPGGVVRSAGEGPVQNDYSIISTPNIFPDAMQGLEYMDRINEGRSGVSRTFTGLQENALSGQTLPGTVSQLSSMAAQRIEQIARIFASQVEYLFSVAHELVLKHGHKQQVVRLRNQWVSVDPTSWRTGRDMRIVIGLGAGNKDVLIQRLMVMANFQKEALLNGSVIASEANLYQTMIELTKAGDFTAPERFWTDPSTVQRPPPKPDPMEIAGQIETAKLANERELKQSEIQQKERDSVRDDATARYRADLDAEVKIVLERLKMGQEVDVTALKAQLANEPIRIETEKIDEAREVISALVESNAAQTEQFATMLRDMTDRLEGVIESANAPREVVRDDRGRIVGVKVNGQTRKVQRDGQGRVTGVQ